MSETEKRVYITHSEALLPALAARFDIAPQAIVEIAAALLKDLHRVAVQSEFGPMGAIYESKWLLGEEGQYHLTRIVAEIVRRESPEVASLIQEDVFRYVSPERDLWNEELERWVDGRSPQRPE